jgi:hypothetical protein
MTPKTPQQIHDELIQFWKDTVPDDPIYKPPPREPRISTAPPRVYVCLGCWKENTIDPMAFVRGIRSTLCVHCHHHRGFCKLERAAQVFINLHRKKCGKNKKRQLNDRWRKRTRKN